MNSIRDLLDEIIGNPLVSGIVKRRARVLRYELFGTPPFGQFFEFFFR